MQAVCTATALRPMPFCALPLRIHCARCARCTRCARCSCCTLCALPAPAACTPVPSAPLQDGENRLEAENTLRERDAQAALETGKTGTPLRAASVADTFSNSEFNARLNGLDPDSPCAPHSGVRPSALALSLSHLLLLSPAPAPAFAAAFAAAFRPLPA